MLNRRELPWQVHEYAFGDDTESDALIYALYADIVAGRLRGPNLANTLQLNGCEGEDCGYVARLAGQLKRREVVEAIYIRLKKRTPPGRFHMFGEAVVPCYDMLQIGLHLLQRGQIAEAQLLELARELVVSGKRDVVGIARSCFDLSERGHIRPHTLARIWPNLREASLVPRSAAISSEKGADGPQRERDHDFVTPARFLDLTES